jgi:hypothetical protein
VQQHRARGLTVTAGAPDLLVVALDVAGSAACTTVRTSALSMPMPNAMVATMTSSCPTRKAL